MTKKLYFLLAALFILLSAGCTRQAPALVEEGRRELEEEWRELEEERRELEEDKRQFAESVRSESVRSEEALSNPDGYERFDDYDDFDDRYDDDFDADDIFDDDYLDPYDLDDDDFNDELYPDLDDVEADDRYTSKNAVAMYIHKYDKLPSNYITKAEAQKAGWDSKSNTLDKAAPGRSIGGDHFGNHEGLLPKKEGRTYRECDIDYKKGSRNAKRIVFSNDGLIFYTGDHYKTFEQLY